MLCGLAPLHHERVAARGGPDPAADPGMWFETSSYGPAAVQAVDAALRGALSGSGLSGGGLSGGRFVLGSDRPYAAPTGLADEAAAELAAADLLGTF
jgi:hypothetical protein